MLLWISLAFAAGGYQDPPEAITQILDAPYPAAVSVSPDDAWMVEMERPALRSIADLAEPMVPVAGTRLNPNTNGPAFAYGYTGLTLRKTEAARRAKRLDIPLPDSAKVRDFDWGFESDKFAFTNTTADGIELWVVTDLATAEPRKLLGGLNAAYGAPCNWLPADQGLVCKVVDPDRGAAPEESAVPQGPRIEENLGRATPARTYTNLLEDPHDEALFEYYLSSKLVHVSLDGTVRELLPAALIDEATPSPDGKRLLVSTLHKPYSYHVPASRFPRQTRVYDLADLSKSTLVSDLPLADDIPIAFDSTRKGRRSVSWRADRPDTLYYVEALDEGDARKEVEHRDAVYLLEAPYEGDGTLLWKTTLRFGGVTWGRDDLAIGYESWWSSRETHMVRLDPSQAGGNPVVVVNRSSQDAYNDPGSPVTKSGPFGWGVLRIAEGDELVMTGRGASPKGLYPFVDRFDLDTQQSKRVWQSADPYYETVVSVLDDKGTQLITRRQSAEEPPNYFARNGRRRPIPLTEFADWAPAFAEVKRELIQYERADGLPLNGTLYLPPGYDAERDGPLPTIFWAYPSEFKKRSDAGQVTRSENTFSRPYGSSHLMLLLEGYAIFDNPQIPIIGEGDEEPNDTYVDQLVSGAEAAVKAVVDKGVADPDKLIIGGHSYGAFTTANLLAHTDLFRAGIARSGAYNRTLTPFGFQAEQRSFWEAPDVYMTMSPFSQVAKIDEPMLMIHGGRDSNSGTYPIQSERMYEAMKGLGATVRWVELPLEDHGYRARESIGHALWEMIRWSDTYAKDAEPREVKAE